MKRILMKCGCVANAVKVNAVTGEKIPCCIIHDCDESYNEVEGNKGLEGRKAKCFYKTCNKIVDSNWDLPFFRYKPNEEYDEYYCGCQGWD